MCRYSVTHLCKSIVQLLDTALQTYHPRVLNIRATETATSGPLRKNISVPLQAGSNGTQLCCKGLTFTSCKVEAVRPHVLGHNIPLLAACRLIPRASSVAAMTGQCAFGT